MYLLGLFLWLITDNGVHFFVHTHFNYISGCLPVVNADICHYFTMIGRSRCKRPSFFGYFGHL